MPTPDGRIGSRDLCTGAVVERVIADGGVTSLKISATLQSDNFSSGSAGWQINRATGSAEFQDVVVRGTLNASDITTGTLDASLITVSNINASNINTGTLNAGVIVISNLDADNITSGSLSSTRLTPDSITSTYMSANSIGTDELQANAVTAATIATGTITANEMAANSIGTSQLQANSVTATEINVSTLSAVAANTGTLTVSSTLTMGSGGILRTASSGQRIEFSNTSAEYLNFYDSGGTNQAFISYDSTFNWLRIRGYESISMYASSVASIGGSLGVLYGDNYVNIAGTNKITMEVGAPSSPSTLTFTTSSIDFTEVQYLLADVITLSNELQVPDGSVSDCSVSFVNDGGMGLYRISSGVMGFATLGVLRASVQSGGFYATTPNTTGSAANLVTAGAAHNNFQRSTSARKYKTQITDAAHLADVVLEPVKFWRNDDKKWFYGFIADDLAVQDRLLGMYEDGEIENYDYRSVMAVMAAKINRLERQVDSLTEEQAA